MKMHKLFGKRGFAVFTALALCVSLVSPSFAATFDELQNVIDTETALLDGDDNVRIGYDNGTVTLYENVTQVDADKNAGVFAIGIKEGQDITLDLNGQTIAGATGTGSAVISVKGGNLTLEDKSEDKTGIIIGGMHGGVSVEDGGSFVMEGGTIEGNRAFPYDGTTTSSGVTVIGSGSSFTMTNGTIKDNNDIKGNAPAVVVKEGASFDMEGGLIESNAKGNKDCVSVEGDSYFTMTGGEIKAKDGGKTVTGDDSKVAIKGGTFSQLDDEYLKGHILVNGVLTHQWSNWETTSEAQVGIDGVQERHCQAGGCTKSETRGVPALEPEPVVETPDEPEVEVEIEIDEPAVPLASGPVTGGEFIDYLWRHEGEPEADVVVDHEYALAISWAQSIGIISGDTFEPDELVTVGVVRDILANFAVYSDMVMPELTTLTGDEDEAVLNCDEVLAEFFGEELSE